MRRFLGSFGLLISVALNVALTAGCGLAVPPTRAGGADRSVTLSATSFAIGRAAEQLVGFARQVRDRSHGSVTVDIGPDPDNAREDTSAEAIAMVRDGRAAVAVVATRTFDTLGVPTLQALQAPLLVTSQAHADLVLADPVADDMLAGLKPLGLVGLGLTFGSLRYPLGYGRPLLNPEDYAGRRISARPSEATAAIVTALGGSVDRRNGQELEQAVAADEVSGSDESLVSPSSPVAGGFITVNVPLYLQAFALVVNTKVFAGLSGAHQQALREAAAATRDRASADQIDAALAAAAYCSSGRGSAALADPGQLSAFRRAVQPVYSQMNSDVTTRRAIARIEKLGLGLPAVPTPEACTGSRPAQSSAVSARGDQSVLDGIWRLRVQADAFLAAGLSQRDAALNDGTWTFTFDASRYEFVEPNGRLCSGEYAVNGRRITMTETSAGCDGVWNLMFTRRGPLAEFAFPPDEERSRAGERAEFTAFFHNPLVRVGDVPKS